jgi:hypothetical protein
MQRNGNAAANVRSATSNTSSASEAELLERLENASPATAVTDPELEATLRALLEDPDPEVRQGAVELLEFWLSQSPEPGATR